MGGASLPGAVTVAFLFCDLTGFTAFADAEGDAAADSFARIVAEQRGEFLLMKSLGDGAMLVYPEGIAAVSAAARIIEQTRLRSPLPVHAGAHVGAAIARDGDYDGGSCVNLAARLLGVAQPDQLIATREVVDQTATHTTGNHSARRRSAASGSQLDVFCLPSRGTHPRTSTAVRSPRRWRAENLELARGEQRLARLAE